MPLSKLSYRHSAGSERNPLFHLQNKWQHHPRAALTVVYLSLWNPRYICGSNVSAVEILAGILLRKKLLLIANGRGREKLKSHVLVGAPYLLCIRRRRTKHAWAGTTESQCR